ncbi:hypothetical protein [Microbulbifer variabilis]|uniref:hypothetical protein n=1 Tax=Microbulbifer variabilis TaxID=266805 RepID=UPI001CFC854C|nr:hypothetical protein [Microbulbifer variabilis]
MNNFKRKEYILARIAGDSCKDVFSALKVVGVDIETLEGVPFGQRNKITQICEDYMDGVLSAEDSLFELIEFVMAVPDKP